MRSDVHPREADEHGQQEEGRRERWKRNREHDRRGEARGRVPGGKGLRVRGRDQHVDAVEPLLGSGPANGMLDAGRGDIGGQDRDDDREGQSRAT